MNNEFPIFHFLCRICIFYAIFCEILSGFGDKFQKRVTCVAFSIKFAHTKYYFFFLFIQNITNRKIAENSEIRFCEKYSLLALIINNFSFVSLGAARAEARGGAQRDAEPARGRLERAAAGARRRL